MKKKEKNVEIKLYTFLSKIIGRFLSTILGLKVELNFKNKNLWKNKTETTVLNPQCLEEC